MGAERIQRAVTARPSFLSSSFTHDDQERDYLTIKYCLWKADVNKYVLKQFIFCSWVIGMSVWRCCLHPTQRSEKHYRTFWIKSSIGNANAAHSLPMWPPLAPFSSLLPTDRLDSQSNTCLIKWINPKVLGPFEAPLWPIVSFLSHSPSPIRAACVVVMQWWHKMWQNIRNNCADSKKRRLVCASPGNINAKRLLQSTCWAALRHLDGKCAAWWVSVCLASVSPCRWRQGIQL